MSNKMADVVMEGVSIILLNFSGTASTYNAAGDRNFGVVLPADVASAMEKDGWNIKYLKPREDGDDPVPWLKVKVKYRSRSGDALRPPKVVMVTSRGQTHLGENEISLLDSAEITNVDLIVAPSDWSVGDKSGVQAYLKSMYVTIHEDYLDLKYAHAGISDE